MGSSTYDYEMQKEKLAKSSEDLKKALDVEIDKLKENAGEWGKVVMVAGGALFLTYMVVKAFRKSKPKKHQNKEQMYYPVPAKPSNTLGRKILEQIAFFVLAIAKQKVLQILEQKQKHEK